MKSGAFLFLGKEEQFASSYESDAFLASVYQFDKKRSFLTGPPVFILYNTISMSAAILEIGETPPQFHKNFVGVDKSCTRKCALVVIGH